MPEYKVAEAFVEITHKGIADTNVALKQTHAELVKVDKQAKTTSSTFKDFLGPIAAGAVLATLIKETVDEERQLTALSAALQSTGQEVDSNLSRIVALSNEMQKNLAIGDELTIQYAAMATNLGLMGTEIDDAAAGAQALAAITGKSVQTMLEALAEFEVGGKTERLAGMFPQLRPLIGDTEAFRDALKDLVGQGVTKLEAAAGTLEKQLDAVRNDISDLAQNVALRDLFQEVTAIIRGMLAVFNQLDPTLQRAIGLFLSLGAGMVIVTRVALPLLATFGRWHLVLLGVSLAISAINDITGDWGATMAIVAVPLAAIVLLMKKQQIQAFATSAANLFLLVTTGQWGKALTAVALGTAIVTGVMAASGAMASETQQKMSDLDKKTRDVANAANQAAGGIENATGAMAKSQSPAERLIADLNSQITLFGILGDSLVRQKAVLDGATDAEVNAIRIRQESLEVLRLERAASAEVDGGYRELRHSLLRLNESYQQGRISAEAFNVESRRLVLASGAPFGEAVKFAEALEAEISNLQFTQEELILQTLKAAEGQGVNVAALRARITESVKLRQAMIDEKAVTQELEAEMERLRGRSEQIAEAVRTPFEIVKNQITELETLIAKGLLKDPEVIKRRLNELRKELTGEKDQEQTVRTEFVGATEFNKKIQAAVSGDKEDKLLKSSQNQERLQAELVSKIDRLKSNNAAIGP